jgi:hypothetical protein
LLEAASGDRAFVTLEDLARPYALNLVEHLRTIDRQGTAPSSRFLNACREFARTEITEDELVYKTVRFDFANVLGAFHVVNRQEIPVRFFVDERGARKGVVLTAELLSPRGNPPISPLLFMILMEANVPRQFLWLTLRGARSSPLTGNR